MTAVAGREPSGDNEIVGHVFGKASPILTWRPAPARPVVTSARPSDPSVMRPSRATTKRVVAWPVIERAGGARTPALRALVTLIVLSLSCGALLTLAIYVAVGGDEGAARAVNEPTRSFAAHVTTDAIDTLSPAPETAPAALPPPTPVAATPAPSPAAHKPQAHHAAAHARRPLRAGL